MARERFGDVEYRIVEDPARPRRRPARRWALGGVAVLVAAASLAAGASALSQHSKRALPGWHNARHMHYGAAGLPPAGPVAGASSADLGRAERFKRNLLYGRILREAAKAR